MSENRYPSASWQHTVTGEFGERITVVAHEDGQHYPGSVTIDIDEQGKRPASVLLARPEQREEFARAWMEACRRADGEPAAMEVPPVTPLDTALQHVREARQFLGERNRYRKALEEIAERDPSALPRSFRDIARYALDGQPGQPGAAREAETGDA